MLLVGLAEVTRKREIRPEGATGDAEAFRRAPSYVESVADDLRAEAAILDQAWEGSARVRFFEALNALLPGLDRRVSDLNSQASAISGKMVTIQETVRVPINKAN
jgi:uncharacterized protein YukE